MDEKSISGGEGQLNRPEFEWDANNIDHIALHHVKPEEAEQVLFNDPVELDFQPDEGEEERWPYVGETFAGRILRVVVTIRGDRIRVVTAFEPSKRNKQVYMAIRAGLHDRSETT